MLQGLAFQLIFNLSFTKTAPLFSLFYRLSYLHSKKIVHRDVKTENMLLDKTRTLKIADFGVARVEASNPNEMTGETGTLGYMAPEVCSLSVRALALYMYETTIYTSCFCSSPFLYRLGKWYRF